MIIERTESPQWTSNSYLVADREGGHAIIIDGNGVSEPLIAKAAELGVTVDAVLVTHWHKDHIEGVAELAERFGAKVYAHAWTKESLAGDLHVDETIDEGDTLEFGDLLAQVLYTPGHTAGQVSLIVNDTDVFTADALFKGTVGGNFAPGNTGYDDHRASVERLLELPAETRVHPGHTLPTTIGDERETNPFVRVWRGDDPEGTDVVTAMGRPAVLLLWGADYDGSNKAMVRFTDDGTIGITGGSQIVRD